MTRILLVDHTRASLLFHETVLRRRAASITTAMAGSEGIDKARREQPNLIMFGFDLFDMSAPDFCREIRKDEVTRAISLLFVGDRTNESHGDLCLEAGCNDVIYRPLERQELDDKIERLTSIPSRRQLRTLTRVEVTLEDAGRLVLGRSLNVSSTGMLLESEHMLPGDTQLRVQFYLPGESRPLKVHVEVLRSEFAGTMARYAVRFLDLQSDAEMQLDRYVQRLRSRELI
jgi:DNA-binding response OmpR family regulator